MLSKHACASVYVCLKSGRFVPACYQLPSSHDFFSQIPGVSRHTKRFESLITFDSSNICCLLFLLINVLYIEIFYFFSSHENARFSF